MLSVNSVTGPLFTFLSLRRSKKRERLFVILFISNQEALSLYSPTIYYIRMDTPLASIETDKHICRLSFLVGKFFFSCACLYAAIRIRRMDKNAF